MKTTKFKNKSNMQSHRPPCSTVLWTTVVSFTAAWTMSRSALGAPWSTKCLGQGLCFQSCYLWKSVFCRQYIESIRGAAIEYFKQMFNEPSGLWHIDKHGFRGLLRVHHGQCSQTLIQDLLKRHFSSIPLPCNPWCLNRHHKFWSLLPLSPPPTLIPASLTSTGA